MTSWHLSFSGKHSNIRKTVSTNYWLLTLLFHHTQSWWHIPFFNDFIPFFYVPFPFFLSQREMQIVPKKFVDVARFLQRQTTSCLDLGATWKKCSVLFFLRWWLLNTWFRRQKVQVSVLITSFIGPPLRRMHPKWRPCFKRNEVADAKTKTLLLWLWSSGLVSVSLSSCLTEKGICPMLHRIEHQPFSCRDSDAKGLLQKCA